MAISHWFDENSYDDIMGEADQEIATKIGDKSFIQKLRFLEDLPEQLTENASNLLLKLQFNVDEITDALQQYYLYDPNVDDLCFNFDISLYAKD